MGFTPLVQAKRLGRRLLTKTGPALVSRTRCWFSRVFSRFARLAAVVRLGLRPGDDVGDGRVNVALIDGASG